MEWVNCSAEIEAKYCPKCGQPTGIQQISFRQVVNDIQSKFLGLDNLLMRTVVDATVRPGQLFQTVLAGNRRRYIGAGGYLFLMLSLMTLLFDVFEVDNRTFLGNFAVVKNENAQNLTRQQAFSDGIMTFISEYIRLISFLMLPIYAVYSRFIFRKSSLNFIEHISLFCYTHAHPLWLTIIAGMLFKATNINVSGVLIYFSIGYSLWLFIDYFKMYPPWKRLLKAILVQVYALLTLGLIGIIAALVFVLSTQS